MDTEVHPRECDENAYRQSRHPPLLFPGQPEGCHRGEGRRRMARRKREIVRVRDKQLYLRKDSDVGKVIVDPFRSLSRLKQLVTGKKTREDHPQVMNAAVRLYADAANAKTKMENGFDLTDYDNRTLAFAKDYSEKLLAIDVNLDTTEMLDVAWDLFGEYFEPAEVNIKQALVDKYWKK